MFTRRNKAAEVYMSCTNMVGIRARMEMHAHIWEPAGKTISHPFGLQWLLLVKALPMKTGIRGLKVGDYVGRGGQQLVPEKYGKKVSL